MTTDERPMEDIAQTVCDLVREQLGKPTRPEDSFARLSLDSLAMAELAALVEKQFQVRLGEDVMDCATIQDLVDYVDEKLAKRQ